MSAALRICDRTILVGRQERFKPRSGEGACIIKQQNSNMAEGSYVKVTFRKHKGNYLGNETPPTTICMEAKETSNDTQAAVCPRVAVALLL